MSKEDFFYKESKTSSKMKKIPKFLMEMNICARKIVGSQEKGVDTQENAVGASEKYRILCKNLQKLSKNEKFHKILQENYIFCAKTALARDKNRWHTPTRWRAPTPVCTNGLQYFCTTRQRLTCRLPCFLRASTAYEHPNYIFIRI